MAKKKMAGKKSQGRAAAKPAAKGAKPTAKGPPVKAPVKGRKVAAKLPSGTKASKGVPGHEQDPKRRLGTFTSMGEHARVGGRTSGIVGQTTKDFGTDNVRTKSTKPRTKHGKGSR